MNNQARNHETYQGYGSHHIHLLHREMKRGKETTKAGHQTTDLDRAILEDKAHDRRCDTKAQRDDACDIHKEQTIDVDVRNNTLHWNHTAADETEYQADATAEDAERAPHVTDGLADERRGNRLFFLVDNTIGYSINNANTITHAPHHISGRPEFLAIVRWLRSIDSRMISRLRSAVIFVFSSITFLLESKSFIKMVNALVALPSPLQMAQFAPVVFRITMQR